MAIKDIRSDLKCTLAAVTAVTAAGTTNGSIIDTADYELGFMLACACTAFTAGSVTVDILTSDAADMSGAVALTADQVIGNPYPLVLSAASTVGDSASLQTFGVIGNKRYIRPRIVAAGATTLTAVVVVVQKGELLPVQTLALSGVND